MGIFARLMRFRHIIQFSPSLIVYIVPRTTVRRQGSVRYSHDRIASLSYRERSRYFSMRISTNTSPPTPTPRTCQTASTHQLATSYQLVKILTSSCSHRHTHATRTRTQHGQEKIPNSIRIIIIIMISIRWIYIYFVLFYFLSLSFSWQKH